MQLELNYSYNLCYNCYYNTVHAEDGHYLITNFIA